MKRLLITIIIIITEIVTISVTLFMLFTDSFTKNTLFYIFVVLNILFLLGIIFGGIFYLVEFIKYRKEKEIIQKDLKEVKYYRDKIKDIPVAILSFIHDEKIVPKKDLIASLLSLSNRGYIEIKNNGIKVLNNDENLFEHERYLIKYKKSIFTSKEKENNWIELIKKDAKVLGLCKINKKKKHFIHLLIIMLFLGGFLTFGFMPFIEKYQFAEEIAMFGLHFSLIYLNILFVNNFENKSLSLSKEGIVLSKNLKGLNNFINDFSILDKRKIEEYILWDEYMLYAIIFNKFGVLSNDTKEKYKMIESWYIKPLGYKYIIYVLVMVYTIFDTSIRIGNNYLGKESLSIIDIQTFSLIILFVVMLTGVLFTSTKELNVRK